MKNRIFKMMVISAFSAFVAGMTVIPVNNVNAAGDIELNANNFPDENLRMFLTDYDYDHDNKLSQEEIGYCGDLWLDGFGIKDVTGIHLLTELTSLHCRSCGLKTLDVSRNLKLTDLDCSNNELTTLDIGKNTAIKELNCENNKLTSIDLSRNAELTDLNCQRNMIKNLDLTINKKLVSLNCGYNQIESLDVSANTDLERLYCGANQMESIDVTNNLKLTHLSCGQNQKFSKLDVTRNNKLILLDFSSTSVKSIDLSNKSELQYLYCEFDEKIRELDISNCPKLISLICDYTDIHYLDLRNNEYLKEAYKKGKYTDMDVRCKYSLDNYFLAFDDAKVQVFIDNIPAKVTPKVTPIPTTQTSNIPKADKNAKPGLISKISRLFPTDYGYERVTKEDGQYLLVEDYDKDFKILKSRRVKLELSRFGGLHFGKDAIYLVFGVDNYDEDDNAEVMRIVKYSKQWKRISSASVKRNKDLTFSDTVNVFNWGGFDTAEVNGKLYIATAHHGYKDPSIGRSHTGLFMVCLDTKTMKAVEARTDQFHSFDQHFAVLDKDNIFLLEDSEGGRCTKVSRFKEAKPAYGLEYTVLEYGGQRTSSTAIATYASTTGIALSNSNVITVGTSIDQTKYDSVVSGKTQAVYKVYMTITPLDNLYSDKVSFKWISTGGKSCQNARFVKIDNNRFAVLWKTEAERETHYRFFDGNGKSLTEEFTIYSDLTHCKPVVRERKVVFCGLDEDDFVFYSIDSKTGKASKTGYDNSGKKYSVNDIGGPISLNKTSAALACGKDLTLKATLTGISSKVKWKSSDTKVATVDSNGKVTAKMAGKVTVTATAGDHKATCFVQVLYKDVTDSGDFWYDPTYYLTDAGVVKGYDNQTKFKPANKCTRAQMVTFIWRLEGSPEPEASTCKFTDVKKGDYFYKACIWGNENHIVEGYKDGTFGPQIVCARKHAVTFLWRLADKPEPKTKTNKFKDVKKSDYFYKATLWASEKKILAGYDDGTFRPNGDCLRRQMVTFLYKYDKFINKKE